MKANVILLLIILLFNGETSLARKSSLDVSNQKKKVVFVKDDDGEFFNYIADLIKKLLLEKNWTSENSEYYVFSLKGKQSTKPALIEKLRELKPDVVLINSPHIQDLALELTDDNIKFVSGGGLELVDNNGQSVLIDEKGFPTKNIAGTYTLPLKHLEDSFAIMKEISPLNGKKVAFATYPQPSFTEKKVMDALKKQKIELKEYIECRYVEEYEEFLIRNENDPEVAWIITGEHIGKTKNGKKYSHEEFIILEREITKKVNFGFWPSPVLNGKLGAYAVDSITTVYQMFAIADSILNGVDLKNIRAEDPIGTLLILNQKRADDIDIKFSDSILERADMIYTDYNGSVILKK